MMVTLSMGILQCNLFANVSTVAGEPHLNFMCSSSLGLWPPGLSNGQASQQPKGVDSALHCHPDLGPQSMLMGLVRHLPLLLSLTFTPMSLERTGRQSPDQALKEPRGRMVPGKKKEVFTLKSSKRC